MCFVLDYDWSASVSTETHEPATRQIACDECSRKIQPGEMLHHIYQQEHESCQQCENSYCECPQDDDGDCIGCKCDEPDFGETHDYDCCDECHKFLKAVKAAEIESGCSEYESQPYLSMMTESISEGGMDEAKKYFKTAQRLYPELVKSGYLGWLWRKIF